jgi:rubrerythrin
MRGGSMSKTFDIKELVRVAVLDERSGKELYRKMSERARSGVVQDTFSNLVDQEKRHEKRFQRILEELESSGEESSGQYPDDYVDYLELQISRGGGSGAHQKMDENQTDYSMIELAIGFEHDQLSLQRDIGTVLGEQHHTLIDDIIREEMGHLVTLSALQRKLGN